MTRTRFLTILLSGLLLLAACDDASTVGIGLVDEQGDPEVRAFAPTLFEAVPIKDETGNAQRVLAGQADDPLLGTLAATGYVDFQRTPFDTTGAPAITGVSLRLRPDYVYGDTTATLSLGLYDMVEDWVSAGAHADTTLSKGPLVTAFDLLPTDTLVTVELPPDWIARNDTTLRSGTFESSFHGFALEATAGNAVVGFNGATGVLRVATEKDTVDYAVFRTLSTLRRDTTATLPPHLAVVQDGAGQGVRLNFDFGGDDLREMPLNGAILRLFADTLTAGTAPAHFVRPLLLRLQLVAASEDDTRFVLGEATLSDEGYYRFSPPLAVNLFSLRELLQRAFFGEQLYDYFELRAPTNLNTINAMLLFDAGAGAQAPEVLLTISPQSR